MVAATDAAECTKLVTFYQYAATPRLTLYPKRGAPQPLPATGAMGGWSLTWAGPQPRTLTGWWWTGRRGGCRPPR